jgi:DNA integrity scanning protein DisA with diadenylate cyclase activity
MTVEGDPRKARTEEGKRGEGDRIRAAGAVSADKETTAVVLIAEPGEEAGRRRGMRIERVNRALADWLTEDEEDDVNALPITSAATRIRESSVPVRSYRVVSRLPRLQLLAPAIRAGTFCPGVEGRRDEQRRIIAR